MEDEEVYETILSRESLLNEEKKILERQKEELNRRWNDKEYHFLLSIKKDIQLKDYFSKENILFRTSQYVSSKYNIFFDSFVCCAYFDSSKLEDCVNLYTPKSLIIKRSVSLLIDCHDEETIRLLISSCGNDPTLVTTDGNKTSILWKDYYIDNYKLDKVKSDLGKILKNNGFDCKPEFSNFLYPLLNYSVDSSYQLSDIRTNTHLIKNILEI